jgi:hypothetical protein
MLVMPIGMVMRAKGGVRSAFWLLVGLRTTPEAGVVKAWVVGMHDNKTSNEETPSAKTVHRPEEETTFMLLLCKSYNGRSLLLMNDRKDRCWLLQQEASAVQ